MTAIVSPMKWCGIEHSHGVHRWAQQDNYGLWADCPGSIEETVRQARAAALEEAADAYHDYHGQLRVEFWLRQRALAEAAKR